MFGQPCHCKHFSSGSAARAEGNIAKPEEAALMQLAKSLADKVGGLPGFGRGRVHAGGLASGNALEQPGHIAT